MAIVQANTFVPALRPVTELVGELALPKLPVPLTTVHVPVPVVAVLPASVALVAHTFWSGPAFAVVGAADRVIVTWSLEAVQEPLVIVQANTFAPTLRPVTELVGEFALPKLPVPLITDHVPVPVVAVLPARVALVAHTSWSGPAFAVVGVADRVMVT